MIDNNSVVQLNDVLVETTHNRGWSVEELAQRAANKIISVGESSHPAIREQALAFHDRIREVVAFYLREAVVSDRTTIANRLRQAGYPDLVDLLK